MLEDDIKIYNAAIHVSPPRLPLREELNIFAIECVYEPLVTKKERHERFKKEKKANEPRKSHKANKDEKKKRNKPKIWPFCGLNANKIADSDVDSQVGSTISLLTMPTILGAESSDTEIEGGSLTDEDDIPSLMFTDEEYGSDSEIDDMTISTFALVGNDNVNPNVVFTHADNTESTKWWYEESSNSEGKSVVKNNGALKVLCRHKRI